MRLLLCGLLAACVSVPKPPDPIFVSVDRRPEERSLPPHPKTTPLPAEFFGEEWVEAVEIGQTATKPGLLISESRAARDVLFRTRYEELRDLYSSDQNVWRVQRKYYEERLNLANSTILELQPTWWDLNKDTIFFWGGMALGAGFTLGVTSIAVGVTK